MQKPIQFADLVSISCHLETCRTNFRCNFTLDFLSNFSFLLCRRYTKRRELIIHRSCLTPKQKCVTHYTYYQASLGYEITIQKQEFPLILTAWLAVNLTQDLESTIGILFFDFYLLNSIEFHSFISFNQKIVRIIRKNVRARS